MHSLLVGVFDDHTRADQAIRQLHEVGVPERQIHLKGKMAGWDISHAIPGNKGIPEEKKPDFTVLGLSHNEARYYEDQYEAGYTIVVVHANDQREQVTNILTGS
jgi:hypothetical protein